MKNLYKIIGVALFAVLSAIASVFLSYSVDLMLTDKAANFAFADFNQSCAGLINNGKQQQLFFIMFCVFLTLFLMILFTFGTKYKADTIEITPKIRIPAPAGEGQNGTARFMTETEKKKAFAQYKLKRHSRIFRLLTDAGTVYYNAARKNKYVPAKELEKLSELPKSGGLVVGMVKQHQNEIISYVSENYHSLIFGATGSGKTRTLVLQSIIFTALAGEGIVVNDPKGELFYYTHRVLQSLGYEVIVMDLQNPEKSCKKNLLQPIIDAASKNEIDKAQRATWDIIEMLVAKNDKGEPIWTNGEKAIIGACILAVVFDNRDKPQYQNLTNVYYFLANMVKPDENNKTPLEAYIAKLDDTHPAKALLGITDVAPSRTRSSFYTSALTTLRLFATSDIAAITSKSDFDFIDIERKKQAIFYILPDQKTSYYPIVTLLVNQQYELLVDYAKEHGNSLSRRVNFFLDEFGNFTQISDIQTKLTVARGYGIRFNLFIQETAQLEDKYDKNIANIIMGNCTIWVYLAAAGEDTNKMISGKLDKYTTLKYSASGNRSKYSNPSSGYSSQLEGRDLLTPEEISRFSRPYQLVMTLGQHPAVMISPDLHKWYFNRMMGLGSKSHNKMYIESVSTSRPNICDTNTTPELWKKWEDKSLLESSSVFDISNKYQTEKSDSSKNEVKVGKADFFKGNEAYDNGKRLFFDN